MQFTFTSSNNNNSSASNRQSVLAYEQNEQGKERFYTSGQGSHNHALDFLGLPLNQNNSQIGLPKTMNLLSLLINVYQLFHSGT